MGLFHYIGFLIEPVLASLEHIFDPKIRDFFRKKQSPQYSGALDGAEKKTLMK